MIIDEDLPKPGFGYNTLRIIKTTKGIKTHFKAILCVQWQGDFMLNVGIATSIGAELWAVKSGLELAWDVSIQQLVMEMDLEESVGAITKDEMASQISI